MSSNAKIVLRKKANSSGQYPLTIRITKNRRSTYHYLGHYINLEYWDAKNIRVRKSHPNASRLNSLLTTELSEINRQLIDLQSEKKDISASQIKQRLFTNPQSNTFFDIAQNFLEELEAKEKFSRYASDKVRVNHVLEFSNSKQLSFKEIDEVFLRNFQVYLKKQGLSERSIVNNLVVVRTIFNRAIKMGLVERKFYPFGSDKIRIKFPETQKIGLNKTELTRIESCNSLSKNENHARNVWLFSFYLAGIRIADVIRIRWSDIYDGRLHYRMNKNAKLISLKVPQKVTSILENYIDDKRHENDFVFPELKKADINSAKDIFIKTKTANKKLNNYLISVGKKAQINKKVSMHIARHSFGTISEDRIPIKMLQKLYRHSDLKTTINYQSNFIHKDADEALEQVINF